MTTDTPPPPKVDHTDHPHGRTGPLAALGPRVHLVVRHDDKLIDACATRHDAAWLIYQLHSCNDYRIEYVPVGAVPLADLTCPT